MPTNPHAEVPLNKEDKDEVRLRRRAIEVVNMLPHDTADAQRVLEFAQQILMWRKTK